MEPLWRRALGVGMLFAFATGIGVGLSWAGGRIGEPAASVTPGAGPSPKPVAEVPPWFQRRYERAPWLHWAAPKPQRDTLRWFSSVDEADLPVHGDLGGTMTPGLIVFPKDFLPDRRHEYYVYANDGHGSLTWFFAGNQVSRPKRTCWHMDYDPGCPTLDWISKLPGSDDYDSWVLQPQFFIPYRGTPKSHS